MPVYPNLLGALCSLALPVCCASWLCLLIHVRFLEAGRTLLCRELLLISQAPMYVTVSSSE